MSSGEISVAVRPRGGFLVDGVRLQPPEARVIGEVPA